MTVPAQIPFVSYTGNGIATAFTAPFRIVEAADMVVLLAKSVVTSGFTISGIGNDACTVTFSSAPSVGVSVILYRAVSLERDTDYQRNGDFISTVVNADFDRIWMALQDVDSAADRALHFPIDEHSLNSELPSAASRAGRTLVFDADGNVEVSDEPFVDPSVTLAQAKTYTDSAIVAATPGIVSQAVGTADAHAADMIAGIQTPTFQSWTPTVRRDGVDYTSGASNSVPLPSTPYPKVISGVFFDTGYQSPSTWTLTTDTVLTFSGPIPLGVTEVIVEYYSPALLGQFFQSGIGVLGRSFQDKMRDIRSVKDFGAKGGGVVDDYAAFQHAIDSGCIVFVPYDAGGYRISQPLNATNREYVTIIGVGSNGPQWGLAYNIPVAGSTIIADTGTFALDVTGSNNVTLRDINIVSTGGLAHPAVIGIVGGTSTDASRLGSPGGSGYMFDNITVAMANVGTSLPIYLNNANLAKLRSVNTLGKYGIALVSNNPLSITPPYASFGTITASDGCMIDTATAISYGDHPALYLENANDLTVLQTYCVYAGGAAGKPSYSGDGYAIHINNCLDVDIKAEVDYFPYMFRMEGQNNRVNISGITYAGPTTTPSTVPIIGYFNGATVKNCKFDVLPIGSYGANNNFHYASMGGGSPTMKAWVNCEFTFDTGASPNVLFLNADATYVAPFFNLRINGNTDVATPTYEINGVAAPLSAIRTFMNGKAVGTA